MSVHLITFFDPSMFLSGRLCLQSAQDHGVSYAWRRTLLEFQQTKVYRENKELLSQPRGCGYWVWKPAIILDAMTHLRLCKEGDVLIYSDAGIEFIDNVNHVIKRMDQDIYLFGNMFEHAHWCKRDIVDTLWPFCVTSRRTATAITSDSLKPPFMEPPEFGPVPWERFGKQVQASVIFFRVNDWTRAFVKEWLDWCLFEGGRLVDDSPSRTPNHPEFQENRHDQAILTTMAYRDGIKLHYWPAVYGPGRHPYPVTTYEDEGLPPMFLHHRKRNHEWEQVA